MTEQEIGERYTRLAFQYESSIDSLLARRIIDTDLAATSREEFYDSLNTVDQSRTKKRSVKRNADIPLILCGPAAHIKRPARDAQPAPKWSCSKGFGGAALNKQNERPANRRGVHFSHDGPIMPCLPVYPKLVFLRPRFLLQRGVFNVFLVKIICFRLKILQQRYLRLTGVNTPASGLNGRWTSFSS